MKRIYQERRKDKAGRKDKMEYVEEENNGADSDDSDTFYIQNSNRSNYLEEERERVKRRVGGFDWRESQVWKHMTQIYGPKLNHEELTSIAEIIAQKTNVKLDRDAKRRKVVLIKWLEEHWIVVEPLLPYIILE